MLGRVHLLTGDLGSAAARPDQSIRIAERDHRLAFLPWPHALPGEPDRAVALLADARTRTNRLADPYVWLDAYILDAQCELGRRHGHRGEMTTWHRAAAPVTRQSIGSARRSPSRSF
jgi:hypothetical protein